jgi:hypothetical protein
MAADQIAYPEWTDYRDKSGLDPLGMQNSSINLYQRLLPGISNVTLRMRYYGLYAWLAAVYARRSRSTDMRKWQQLIRRAEGLYALAAVHGGDDAGVSGSRWARRKLAASSGRISFAEHADPDGSASPYLQQKWGAYGAAYGSQVFEIGVLAQAEEHDVPVPSPEIGDDLAVAFPEALGLRLPRAPSRPPQARLFRVEPLGPRPRSSPRVSRLTCFFLLGESLEDLGDHGIAARIFERQQVCLRLARLLTVESIPHPLGAEPPGPDEGRCFGKMRRRFAAFLLAEVGDPLNAILRNLCQIAPGVAASHCQFADDINNGIQNPLGRHPVGAYASRERCIDHVKIAVAPGCFHSVKSSSHPLAPHHVKVRLIDLNKVPFIQLNTERHSRLAIDRSPRISTPRVCRGLTRAPILRSGHDAGSRCIVHAGRARR